MRQTRWQWLAQILKPLKLPQRQTREQREPAPLKTFRYAGQTVQAHTKGEARAKLKQLAPFGRLPAGAAVQLV